MAKKKIAFDAGHGVDTYPKTGSKGVPSMAEFEFNSSVVKYAKELAEFNGFEVILTQPLDGNDVPLSNRTNLANSIPVELLISFHADANGNPDARGHWCFYWYTSSNGKRMAQIWDKHATNIMDNPSRGIVESKPNSWTNFHMVRETYMPAILLEHAFMTNAEDLKLLKSYEFRRKCAEVAVRTVCEYFGVNFKKPEPVKEVEKSATTKEVGLEDWQVKLGETGIDSLVNAGLITDPEGWKNQLGENVPVWLFYGILGRILDHTENKDEKLLNMISNLQAKVNNIEEVNDSLNEDIDRIIDYLRGI